MGEFLIYAVLDVAFVVFTVCTVHEGGEDLLIWFKQLNGMWKKTICI